MKITFADLFSGIGGFHLAFQNVSNTENFITECLYASEIDRFAKDVYHNNFGFSIDRMLEIKELQNNITEKKLDVIFCGFPCQPFSSAGKQKGFNDEGRGKLIFDVINFVKKTKPKVILLENVKNLINHNNKETINKIVKEFDLAGYKLISEEPEVLSPHQFGIKQKRYRVFIPLVRKDLSNEKQNPKINKEDFMNKYIQNMNKILDDEVDEKYFLNDELNMVLNAWAEFVKKFRDENGRIPIFYIDDVVFGKKDTKKYQEYKWYKIYMDKMELFYKKNKKEIDEWILKYDVKNWTRKQYRKLEWQASNSDFNDTFLQIRQSGMRFKKNDTFPTLVALVQTSIVYSKNQKRWRRLTPREVSRLQSFPENFILSSDEHQAYKQFGNSVNVKVVEYIIRKYLLDVILKK
ncbi:MAG: DNA cytosine methyltransferase [Ureaplasma sp.]|nr:DNA cytosine methyltransferase [Ureaplasma sp.]